MKDKPRHNRYDFMHERHIERKADAARQAYLTCPDHRLDEIIGNMGKPDEIPVVMTGQGSFVKRWPKG